MKKILLLGLSIMVLLVFVTQSSAFSADAIYSQYVEDGPTIDGTISDGEWVTEEEVFQETLTGLAITGAPVDMKIDITTLRNESHIFFLVKVLTKLPNSNGNLSVGIALAADPIATMVSIPDRKVAFWNTSNTILHDLYFNENGGIRGFTPGSDDPEDINFDAKYGEDGEDRFFEFAIPMAPADTNYDLPIKDGIHVKFIVNPFNNMYEGQNGHGAKGSDDLEISFSPRSFFQRPPPGMDTMTMIFVGFFALLVSGVAITFIYSGISESFSRKVWVIKTTEKMAQQSILQEIAYYNSNFLSMLLSFFLLLYSSVTLAYSFWAQWYTESILPYFITIIPLVLSLYALIDLGKRNENLHLKENIEDRMKKGSDMNKSDKLWLVPTTFLILVLLMLVFIGIGVLS